LPLLLLGMAAFWYLFMGSGTQREGQPDPGTAGTPDPGLVRQGTRAKTPRTGPPAVVHDAVDARVTIVPEPPGLVRSIARKLTDGLLADGDDATSTGWVSWEPGAGPVEVTLEL